MTRWMLAAAILMAVLGGYTEAEEYTVLADPPVPPGEMLREHLLNRTAPYFDQRREAYEALATAEDIQEYQARQRAFFIEQLGGFPERTPLNARVTATLDRDGYRVEKVLFESQPGFYVTGLMFLPGVEPPYPGVLVPCGHTVNGKAGETYQRACILLAKNGIAAFIYDPIGQGERFQLLDEQGQRKYPPTREHTQVGVGSILLGENAATIRIWDGIRAMDYLESREDVDAARLGCTGNSGGGTLTAYLMALDDRISVAAASCYLTSFERLLNTIGAQDAEQNIHAQVAFGMDHADYIHMRAPKPTLMCTATQDYFDIGGAWTAFREAKRLYERLGYAERVDIIETDAPHGFSKPLREGMARFMLRWLAGHDEAVIEPDFEILTDEEAQVTPDGQVLLLPGARSAFEINADTATRLRTSREARNQTAEDLLSAVRGVTGIRPLDELPRPRAERMGTLQRDGYRVEKLALWPEEGAQLALPALLFAPEPAPAAPGAPALYLHGEDKAAEADGAILERVRRGQTVLAVDLRGIGETRSSDDTKGYADAFGRGWPDMFTAYLMGTSFLAMRAEDALVSARFLRELEAIPAQGPVELVAHGEAVPPALHAAALTARSDLFGHVTLDRGIVSWEDVVKMPENRNQLVNTVHGALRVYDLPGLVALLPEGSVTVVNPVDPAGAPLN